MRLRAECEFVPIPRQRSQNPVCEVSKEAGEAVQDKGSSDRDIEAGKYGDYDGEIPSEPDPTGGPLTWVRVADVESWAAARAT